jgi:hypothetical protein
VLQAIYQSSWLKLTLIAMFFLAFNAFYRLYQIDLTTVDYFLKERFIDRHLATYLMGSQLIFNTYIGLLPVIFFKDLRAYHWVMPLFSKGKLAIILLIFILFSGLFIYGYSYTLNLRLSVILPVSGPQYHAWGLSLYLSLMYLSVMALFKEKGVAVFLAMSHLALLYPVIEMTALERMYQLFGLYSVVTPLHVTALQTVLMGALCIMALWIRLYKRPLF